MASELGLIYSVGRRWTGSMIELGYNRSSLSTSSNCDWMSLDDTADFATCELKHDATSSLLLKEQDIGRLLRHGCTQEYVLDHLLAASKLARNAGAGLIRAQRCCKNLTGNKPQKKFLDLPKTIERWLLEMLRDKTRMRYSLTSLMPSENSNSSRGSPVVAGCKSLKSARCHSTEPDLRKGNESGFFNRFRDRIHNSESNDNPLSLPFIDSRLKTCQFNVSQRKRLSLSDSEISYTENMDITAKPSIESLENYDELILNNTSETLHKLVTNKFEPNDVGSTCSRVSADLLQCFKQSSTITFSVGEEFPSNETPHPCPEVNIENDIVDEEPKPCVQASSNNSELDSVKDNSTNEQKNVSTETHDVSFSSSHQAPDVIQMQKKPRKSVRFADEVGNELTQERLVGDSSLPPLLRRVRLDSLDDDFPSFGDDYSFPGLRRPSSSFSSISSLKSCLPGVVLPPVPHIGSSSSDSIYNMAGYNSKETSRASSEEPEISSWRLTFAQPAAQYLAFRQRLESNCVSLENVSLLSAKKEPNTLRLYGTVKVKNIAFEKSVKLRVTKNRWASFKDYPATHSAELSSLAGSSSPFDTFMFNLSTEFSDLEVKQCPQLQFAVCFQAGFNGNSGEFWDNNDGCNYVIEGEVQTKLSTSPLMSSSPVSIAGGLKDGNEKDKFFRLHPSNEIGTSGCSTVAAGESIASIAAPAPYTLDFRPNFQGFSSLTSYSSWQHYSSESMYY